MNREERAAYVNQSEFGKALRARMTLRPDDQCPYQCVGTLSAKGDALVCTTNNPYHRIDGAAALAALPRDDEPVGLRKLDLDAIRAQVIEDVEEADRNLEAEGQSLNPDGVGDIVWEVLRVALRALPSNRDEGLPTSPYVERGEHEVQSSIGHHLFDPQCPFCFFDHFDPEARAALATDRGTDT